MQRDPDLYELMGLFAVTTAFGSATYVERTAIGAMRFLAQQWDANRTSVRLP